MLQGARTLGHVWGPARPANCEPTERRLGWFLGAGSGARPGPHASFGCADALGEPMQMSSVGAEEKLHHA